MENADQAALELLADDALDPTLVEEGTRRAVAELLRSRPETAIECERLVRELVQLEAESQRLTAAIAAGGNLPGLLEALRDRDQRRAPVRARLDAFEASARTAPLDPVAIEARAQQG